MGKLDKSEADKATLQAANESLQKEVEKYRAAASGVPIADVELRVRSPKLASAATVYRAAAPALSVHVHALALEPSAARTVHAGATTIWIETSLLGVPDSPLRTPALPLPAGATSLTFDYELRAAVAAHSAAEERLLAAVASRCAAPCARAGR